MRSGRTVVETIRQVVAGLEVGWWVFAAVVGTVIAFVAWVYLPWVVFGLFVYYVARPIQQRLVERLPSKSVAAVTTLVLVVAPVITILAAAVLVTISQLSTFLTEDVVARIDLLLPVTVQALPRDSSELLAELLSAFSGGTFQAVFSSVTRTIGSVASGLFNAFLSFLFAFFLLRDDDRLVAWFYRDIAGKDSDLSRYLGAVDSGLESVYFGYTVTIFVVMVLASVVYTVFNLFAPSGLAIPSPVALAVVTGLFTVIPLVGRSIVYFAVAAYLVVLSLQSNPTSAWFPMLFLAVMELPFDNLIRVYVRPALSGRLFPMGLIVFAYLIGPPLFGWWGIFYGPFLMVVVVVFLQTKFPQLVNPSDESPSTEPEGKAPASQQVEDSHLEPGVDAEQPTDLERY